MLCYLKYKVLCKWLLRIELVNHLSFHVFLKFSVTLSVNDIKVSILKKPRLLNHYYFSHGFTNAVIGY